MKKNIRNLIDLKKVDTLLEGFNKSTGFVTAILDLDGNVLSKSGWRPICTQFHRINAETVKRCAISDTELASKMEKGEKYNAYKCLNGLIDVVVPLKIKGEHVANLFSGQFFFEKPDVTFFRKQAKEFGFDENKYLDALSKVPVVSEEKVKTAMDFLLNMTEFISDLAIQKLEQAELNQDLRDSEQKFKSVFESMGTATLIVEDDTTILMANSESLNITGYTSAELIGQKWTNYVAQESLQEMLKNHHLRRKNPKLTPRKYEVKLLNSKGEKRNVVLNVNMIPGTQQSVVSMLDITERKQTEAALQKSKSSLEEYFENDISADYVVSVSGEIFSCNKTFLNLFGFEKKLETEKIDITGIYKNPEDRKQMISLVKKQGKVENLEMEFISKEGKTIYALINAIGIFDNDDKLEKIRGYVVDISEQKNIEKELVKFKLGIERSSEAIFITDVEGHITFINPAFEKLYGYASDECIGKTPRILKSGTYNEEVYKDFWDTLLSKNAVSGEIVNKTKKGLLLTIDAYNTSIFDSKGEIHGFIGIHRDITERKRVQLEYQTMIKTSRDGFWIVDAQNGKFIEVNQSYCEMIGYSREELLQMTIHDIEAVETQEETGQHIELIMEKGFDSFESKHKTKSGRIIDVDASVTFIGSDTNKFFVFVRDISERKKVENEILKLSHAVKQSPASIIITDLEGNMEYVNPKTLEITGYTKEELIGKNPRIFNSGEKPKEEYQQLWSTILSGKEWFGEFHNKKKNGEFYWEFASISPIINEKQEIINYVAIKEDVTERKRFEDTRKLLLEIPQLTTKHFTLTSFLAEVHQKIKHIIRADNFYVALYNEKDNTYSFPYYVDEYDEVELNKPYDFSNGYTDYVLKSNQSLIVTPEYQLEVEKEGTIKGYGDEFSVWLGVPFKTTEDSKPKGVMSIQDYKNTESYTETDKSIMEIIAQSIGSFIERIIYLEELVKAKEKAEESSRLKTAFLNNISHEIRTPMNSILGFSRLLKNSDIDHEKKLSYIETINNSSNHLLSIITDIINISLIEAGQGKIRETRVNVNDILDKISKQHEIRSKDIEIKFLSVLTPEQAEIYTDETKLIQIINNLLGNAIKFTQQGYIQCACKLEKDFVRFDISDTGIGIPKDQLKKIFERFIQTKNTVKNALGGMGLGLAIAKSYVELLGGQIWVTSKPNKGSVFSFTIPFKPVTEKILIENKYDKINETKLTQATILIVEDEYYNFMLIQEMLSEFPLNIRHAENGQKAVDMALNNSDLDLVLMDIKMPIMDGFEALKKIKAVKPKLKIIAQTAYALQGDKAKIKSSDFDDYIEKPIDQLKLFELLKKYIVI